MTLDIKRAPTPEQVLEQAKQRALSALNDDYQAETEHLVRDYPPLERETWSDQKSEAQRYRSWENGERVVSPVTGEPLGDEPPETPVLSQILAGRNEGGDTETMEQLVAAVLSHVERFTQWQQATGRRQRGEWAIRKAATAEQAEAVTWRSLQKG